MAYILYFFLAFATPFLAPWVGAEILASQEGLALYTPLLTVLPYGLAGLVKSLQLRGRRRAAALGERVLRYLPVLLQATVLLGMGGMLLLQSLWPASLGELELEGTMQWPGLALAAALVPYFVFQVLVIDARVRLFESGEWVARARSFQLRMFLSTLVPFILIGLLSSALEWNEVWSVRLEEVGLLGAGACVLLLLFAMLVLPRLLTWVWNTQSLPAGDLRQRLEGLAERAGLRFRDLMLWRTGNMTPNALIVGFSPGTRRVLLTDALVEMLSDDELEAVFGHEMGHAKRQHGLLLGAFALGALLGTEVLIGSLAPMLSEQMDWDLDLISMGMFLVALAAWGRSFGAFSRQLEMEADLESLKSTGNLKAIVNTLLKVTAPQANRKASWRHPSTAKRVAFLLSVAGDAAIGARMQERLRWMKHSALLLFVSAVAYRSWIAAGDWDRDWLLADLRLGHYQEAQARVEAGSDVSEALAALVSTGANLDLGHVGADEMLALGLLRLQEGDLVQALQLVELCFMRGRRDLGGMLLALDQFLEGEEPAPGELPRAWREALNAIERPKPHQDQ